MGSDSEGDRLYALPLEEFTKARDQLAVRLKSAGDAEESARVKTLKKPTTPAWAVNQLARRSRDTVEELIASADRLRRAQQELLQGGPAQKVWEATLAEREALGQLTQDAERILTDAGYGAHRPTLDKISDTLAAAAADPNARDLLRRGVLTSEMHRTGFADLIAGDVPEPRAPPANRKRHLQVVRERPAPASRAPAGPSAKEVLEAERAEVRSARAAERAEEEADRAARDAERAEESAASLRKRLATGEDEARRARAAATAARKEAERARREAERSSARHEKVRKNRRS